MVCLYKNTLYLTILSYQENIIISLQHWTIGKRAEPSVFRTVQSSEIIMVAGNVVRDCHNLTTSHKILCETEEHTRGGCKAERDQLRIRERKGFSTEYCIMGQRVASLESFLQRWLAQGVVPAVVRRTLLNFMSLPGLQNTRLQQVNEVGDSSPAIHSDNKYLDAATIRNDIEKKVVSFKSWPDKIQTYRINPQLNLVR